MSDKKTARLVLEDGTLFKGYSFGAATSVPGEVVFNTAMTGYPESLTDPSYSGQILVITYPLVGNYGVPQFTEENGMLRFFESNRIHIRGLVISDYSFEYSHWNAVESLGKWLADNDVPAICGVDTRQITKIIRERGVMLGKVLVEGTPEPEQFVDPNRENLVAQVSTKQAQTYGNGRHRIVLVDCGCKYNIIRCLCDRDATVIRVPWDYDFTQLEYDGVMLSNGPGDPQDNPKAIKTIRELMGKKPMFGICLGHQLMALAMGGRTVQMKYGHHGANHPVKDLARGTCSVTAQNHGFMVDPDQLPAGAGVSHLNWNDQTVEGVRYTDQNAFSVQFHPEACGGPCETAYLFDDFIAMIKANNVQ